MAIRDSQRDDTDVYRLAPLMDEQVLQVMADRLEFRARDPGYLEISQDYFQLLPLDSMSRLLSIGCGTGVELRALRARAPPKVQMFGVDHSSKLIEVARRK